VAWLFVQSLNQATSRPLHEPYERRAAETAYQIVQHPKALNVGTSYSEKTRGQSPSFSDLNLPQQFVDQLSFHLEI
jgi:hypothetical protein